MNNDRLAGGKRSLRKEGRGPPGVSSFSVPFLGEGSLGQDWQMWGVGRHNAIGSGNVRCACIQVRVSVQIRVNFKRRRAGGCEWTRVCVCTVNVCACVTVFACFCVCV